MEKPSLTQDEIADARLMKAALDGAITAVMMVDRDLIITYANRGTYELLRKHRAEFNAVYPDLNIDQLIGTCIDILHRRPQHQRQMLANPANLPHVADIRVGKLAFQIGVSALYDSDRNYIGNTLEWIDITDRLNREADSGGQIAAINKAQAVIEFELDGTIRSANENFLRAFGYRLEDVKAKHHSTLVEPSYAGSSAYREFWENLRAGRYEAGEYKRIGSGGREVWIQASYNPIFDLNGRPFKVVKYATDITAQKLAQQETERLVEEARRSIEALAEGDLTQPMEGDFQGGFALLKERMNHTIETLRETVVSMEESSRAVASAARDIAEGNANLNKRTQEQSSALEETSASLEQMTSTVKQNGERAASQPACHGRQRRGQEGRPGRGIGRRSDVSHHRELQAGCRHHWCDRADRIPNEHAGAERGSGSGASW